MSTRTNELRGEKDYVINYIKLVDSLGREYDFKGNFASFTYEENIFSGPHGTLLAIDPVDYPTLLPMIGQESIKFSFTRPDEKNPGTLLPPITVEMPIYSLTGKKQMQGSKKLQSYTLQYISSNALEAFGNRIFKAYRGELYSKMVEDIFQQFIQNENNTKPIEIEKTIYEVDYTINNERPYTAIKKICKRSVSEEGNGTTYTFYEDRDKFYFVSIGKMFQRPIVQDYTYLPKNIDKDKTVRPKPENLMYGVSEYSQGTNFDLVRTLQSGENNSHLVSINPLRRKIVEKSFDLREEYDNFKHLETGKRFEEELTDPQTGSSKPIKLRTFSDPKSNPMMIISNIGNNESPYISEKQPNIKTSGFEDYKQYTRSQLEQILRNITVISVSGDPRIRAGDIINFKLPESLGKTSSENPEQLDRYMQGKYLVASVCHKITQNEYTMNLELIKDSYHKSIKPRDPVEEYKNIQ